MINLKSLFNNPFDSSRISDDNLRKFSEDHLQRTTANNGTGIYTATIAATTPLVNAFATSINAENMQSNIQKGKTLAADKLIEEFKSTTSRREGSVRGAFGENSPQYLEFFPLGLSEYSQLTKANVLMLMDRMKNRTAHYVADLSVVIASEFSDLHDNYEAARTQQLLAFGQVEVLRTATATDRVALVKQLGENLHFIAGKNQGYPDRLDDFMDQSIVRHLSDSDDGMLDGIVQGGAILNIESSGITSTTQFKLRNVGVTQLLFALSTAADIMPAAAGITVQPGEMSLVPASALGPTGNNFLNIQNLSADVAGGWQVTIL